MTLTKREQEVYALLLQGLQNKEIASQLGLCEKTVRFHSRHIYQKAGVHSRAKLIVQALAPHHLVVQPRTPFLTHLECVQKPELGLPRGRKPVIV